MEVPVGDSLSRHGIIRGKAAIQIRQVGQFALRVEKADVHPEYSLHWLLEGGRANGEAMWRRSFQYDPSHHGALQYFSRNVRKCLQHQAAFD